jgi:hypothetical protein
MRKSGTGGFSLVEIMIAMGLMMAIGLGMAQLMNQMNMGNMRTAVLSTAQQLRSNFSEMIRNDQAFASTVNDPANKTFHCLVSLTDCNPAKLANTDYAPGPFRVHNASGGLFFDGIDPGNGFTQGGARCNDYPSAGCVLRVQLSWHPLCSPDTDASHPCLVPQIEVLATTFYTPPGPNGRFPFNPQNYGFSIIKTLSAPGADFNGPASQPTASPVPIAVGANADGNPASGGMDVQNMCKLFGAQLNDPSFTNMLKSQLTAMGYADPDQGVQLLRTQCQGH